MHYRICLSINQIYHPQFSYLPPSNRISIPTPWAILERCHHDLASPIQTHARPIHTAHKDLSWFTIDNPSSLIQTFSLFSVNINISSTRKVHITSRKKVHISWLILILVIPSSTSYITSITNSHYNQLTHTTPHSPSHTVPTTTLSPHPVTHYITTSPHPPRKRTQQPCQFTEHAPHVHSPVYLAIH